MNEEFAANKAPVEELTIPTIDLNPSPVAAQTEDWGMTNPLGKPSDGMKNDGWRMPEPVFRASEGFCPLKSTGRAAAKEKPPKSVVPPMPAPPADPPPLSNIYAPPENDVSQHTMHNLSLSDLHLSEPEITAAAAQPNISQEYTIKPPASAAATEEKRGETARLFFAAAGVLAMLAFAAAFLALVYFLFFYKAAE